MAIPESTPDLLTLATWRPEQFTRCTNPGFEVDTTGWAVTAGATITRITTDSHTGAACAQVVTDDTDGSGVTFDLGSDRYLADAAHATLYVARFWLRRISGGRRLVVTLGSAGTPEDRASLVIDDLSDVWREYAVSWRPSADRTDAELVIATGDASVGTFHLDDVSIYSPLSSQVEDGHFETDTTGWDIGASHIAGVATSLTRITAEAFGGDACAELVTTATSGSGADYAFGTRRFLAGRTYRLRVGLKRMSGATQARLRLGSVGTAADRGDATVTLTDAWAWHTVDWTPSADRTDVALAISNASAAALTVRLDEAEVYEALDQVTVRELTTERGSMSGAAEATARASASSSAAEPVDATTQRPSPSIAATVG